MSRCAVAKSVILDGTTAKSHTEGLQVLWTYVNQLCEAIQLSSISQQDVWNEVWTHLVLSPRANGGVNEDTLMKSAKDSILHDPTHAKPLSRVDSRRLGNLTSVPRRSPAP